MSPLQRERERKLQSKAIEDLKVCDPYKHGLSSNKTTALVTSDWVTTRSPGIKRP